MADGWAVDVTMWVMGGGQSKQTYYAHVPDRTAAEEAVKLHILAPADVKVEARKPVAHNAFVGVNIPEGGVGQW